MIFFVLDTRTEREPEYEEIIGEEQMAALLKWLKDGSERVKFVVTSVPFFPDIKKKNDDKWSGYLAQRDQIITHIRKNKLRKVVFLSGDVHCSMSAELNISEPGEDPLKIYSIISSPFYWPYRHMKRSHFNLKGHVASNENENAYLLGKVSRVFSSDNFTRVKASSTSIEIEVFERKGARKQTHRFQF